MANNAAAIAQIQRLLNMGATKVVELAPEASG
jgi:hypothetical protein